MTANPFIVGRTDERKEKRLSFCETRWIID